MEKETNNKINIDVSANSLQCLWKTLQILLHRVAQYSIDFIQLITKKKVSIVSHNKVIHFTVFNVLNKT